MWSFIESVVKGILEGKYSLTNVLIIFFVVILIGVILQLIFKFDTFQKQIEFIKNLYDKRRKKKLSKVLESEKLKERLYQEAVFSKTVEQNSKIYNILELISKEFSADRVSIFQYHNTGYYKTGLSQMKASITYEICANGIQSEKVNFQSIPISLFAFWNSYIRDNKTMYFPDIEELRKEDRGSYENLKSQNVKSIFNIGLYTKEGFAIGFLGVEYCNIRRDLSFEERIFLSEKSKEIARLLL
jgi:hypothetical protein